MKTHSSQLARVAGMLALVAPGAAAEPPPPDAAPNAPCQIRQRARIQFPARALSQGIVYGEVLMMIDVDSAGRLLDVLPVAYTRRDFAEAALAAIKEWRFTPARIGGEPAGSNITLNVKFEVAGVLAYVKPIGDPEEQSTTRGDFVYRPVNVAGLDRMPLAVAREGPIYPREWIVQGRTGGVTVDFFIDEKGQVRLPRIVGDADQYLAASALAAVKGWRFEPPRQKGRPVLTRATQVFHFRPQAPGPNS